MQITDIYNKETSNNEINQNPVNGSNPNSKKEYRTSEIPSDLNDFFFSRKRHLQFFSNNFYEFELFGNRNEEFDNSVKKYQTQLTYFYMKKYMNKDAKILYIGDNKDKYFRTLVNNTEYEYWFIEDPRLLSEIKDTSAFNIEKLNNRQLKRASYYGFFDMIITISGIDKLNLDEYEHERRDLNINLFRLLKPGGILNLQFSGTSINGKPKINNLFFSFFKDYFRYINSVYYYRNPINEIKNENSLLFEENKNDNTSSKKYFAKEDKQTFKFSFNILQKKEFPLISKHTITNNANFRLKRPTYFFHHLIKCGGSSLGAILTKWFNFENDLYDKIGGKLGFDYGGNLNNFLKYKFNIENLSSDCCIRGHFQHKDIFIDQRYPEIFNRKNEYRVFTFVRDPYKVLLSLYYFGRKREYDYKDISLETFFKSTRNFLSYLLNCNEDNYKEILDRYYFIGIVDNMQESIDKLADRIGNRRIKVPLYNTTKKDTQLEKITPEFKKFIKEYNSLDYKIYNYSIEKFNKF
ncbi:MAG: hypothetical protein HGGPFJEG_00939 [Ignavibacteria bacterium]|nr:hypothetical protein [Ignavibacteria bacterium]